MTAPSLREAATMALDALEIAREAYEAWGNGTTRIDAAIEALRAALALPDAEPYAYEFQKLCDDSMGKGWETDISRTVPTYTVTQNIKPLYVAPQPTPLALPDAEPVAWRTQAGSLVSAPFDGAETYGWIPLYAAPQPAPVKQSQYGGPELQALILAKLAAPVERKPLTNEQKEAIWGKAAQLRKYSKQIFMDGMNAAEAAHGIQGAT